MISTAKIDKLPKSNCHTHLSARSPTTNLRPKPRKISHQHPRSSRQTGFQLVMNQKQVRLEHFTNPIGERTNRNRRASPPQAVRSVEAGKKAKIDVEGDVTHTCLPRLVDSLIGCGYRTHIPLRFMTRGGGDRPVNNGYMQSGFACTT